MHGDAVGDGRLSHHVRRDMRLPTFVGAGKRCRRAHHQLGEFMAGRAVNGLAHLRLHAPGVSLSRRRLGRCSRKTLVEQQFFQARRLLLVGRQEAAGDLVLVSPIYSPLGQAALEPQVAGIVLKNIGGDLCFSPYSRLFKS